jgi:hypothetical protein
MGLPLEVKRRSFSFARSFQTFPDFERKSLTDTNFITASSINCVHIGYTIDLRFSMGYHPLGGGLDGLGKMRMIVGDEKAAGVS